MLLLSDNDIFLKLSLLELFDDLLNSLNLSHKDVFITNNAKYSLIDQVSKYSSIDQNLAHQINKKIKALNIIEIDESMYDLLDELGSQSNIDSGEAILAVSLINNSRYYMATGDKRFLKAIAQTEYREHFKNRIFTFELCLLNLCQFYGYSYVKQKVLIREGLCLKIDNLFKMAFKETTDENNDIECLISFSKEMEEFHHKN